MSILGAQISSGRFAVFCACIFERKSDFQDFSLNCFARPHRLFRRFVAYFNDLALRASGTEINTAEISSPLMFKPNHNPLTFASEYPAKVPISFIASSGSFLYEF
jgi:hypothetical protein